MSLTAGFSKTAPRGATPYTVLKIIGVEAALVAVLTVVAGAGAGAAEFAIGLLAVIWLLLLVSHTGSSS